MNVETIKIEIDVKKTVYESAHKRFSDSQLEQLLGQHLEDIAKIPIHYQFASL